jgi:hypothetical protein
MGSGGMKVVDPLTRATRFAGRLGLDTEGDVYGVREEVEGAIRHG